MTTLPLKKDYVVINSDGSKTTYSKNEFEIFVSLENINPSEKTISIRFTFRNKVSGVNAIYYGNSLNFNRDGNRSIVNDAEIKAAEHSKISTTNVVNSYTTIIAELNSAIASNTLADDEIVKITEQIEDNQKSLEEAKAKLAAIVIPEPVIEISQDFDSVVRDYFGGFTLNSAGVEWVSGLIDHALGF